ncbi:hypothetical protein [Xanthocytophaga flava]|uniref:hypothetical protein n=1 Tax=Xanthocytophaga flava TaxID=3048013 RepID=UPI0028D08C25|nr:hypothetical protein [Xanthocytophaga flavus]MDJ1470351.1 hypothetical protein [Xanthocytophaga flavus]
MQSLHSFGGPTIALLVEYFKKIATGIFEPSNSHPDIIVRYRKLAEHVLNAEKDKMIAEGSFDLGVSLWRTFFDRVQDILDEGYVIFNPFGKILYPLVEETISFQLIEQIEVEMLQLFAFGNISKVKKSFIKQIANSHYKENKLFRQNIKVLLQHLKRDFESIEDTINLSELFEQFE